jgi:glycosyltransferase involved in cell wall biosynthesis
MPEVPEASEKVLSIDAYRLRQASEHRLIGGSRCNNLGEEPRPIQDLVSIITVTFNSARTLERTMDSIRTQTYPLIEYIVIDGGSTDGTLEIISSRDSEISQYISEPDTGISDAFNKGIAIARGQFVAIVNSDDWLEADHIYEAVAALRGHAVDFVFGDIQLHKEDATPAGRLVGDPSYRRTIRHIMPSVNHPSMVCHWETYRKFGLYRLEYRNAMDYDWFLRVTLRGGLGLYVSKLASHMSLAGVSDREFNRSLDEVRRISISHGYPAILATVRFYMRVFKGMVRRVLARTIPLSVYEQLREFVNPRYRSSTSR